MFLLYCVVMHIFQVPRIARHFAIQIGTMSIGAIHCRCGLTGLNIAYCCRVNAWILTFKTRRVTQTQNFRICTSLMRLSVVTAG